MTTDPDELFVFNGIDGATGGYLLPPMTSHALVGLAEGKGIDEVAEEARQRYEAEQLPDYAPREDVDPKSLAESGWGVIFAHDADPAVREALQPLLDHRRAQASSLAPHRYREFSGADGYRPGERKAAFLGRHKAPTSGPVDPDRMPYYLLIVGSPETISCEFQAQLDLQHAVGRLCFDTLDEYESYAKSVIASESGQVRVARRLGLFGVRNPDDRATNLSAEGLIGGLERYVQAKVPSWSVDVRAGEQATKAELAKLLGGPETPAVLFTASHGMGFPNGHPRQLAHQGALLCQDWRGPREHTGPVSPDLYFAGEDLGDSARLTGLIAFLFACYGGGTPRLDAFFHASGKEPRPIAPHAFFAGLPTRMLGHPRGGALAAVGHVERAWGCSFFSPKSGHQIAVFESFIKRLLDGHPIGSALDCFGTRYGELSSGLLEKLQERKYGNASITETEIANDWTANNDARNYMILGDPAVRVPVADDGEALPRPVLELRSTAEGPVTSQAPAAGPEEDPASFGLVDRLRGRPEGAPEGAPEGGVVDALKGFVAKLGHTISSALADMSNLDVKTYVARDMSTIAVEGGQLHGAELRAYTRISLDGDTIVCVPERDGELDKALFELHLGMVARAQEARTELMKTIIHAASSLVGFTK